MPRKPQHAFSIAGSLEGFQYWHSRYVLARSFQKGSDTLEVDFCVEALEEALGKGKPEIFNRTRPDCEITVRNGRRKYRPGAEIQS